MFSKGMDSPKKALRHWTLTSFSETQSLYDLLKKVNFFLSTFRPYKDPFVYPKKIHFRKSFSHEFQRDLAENIFFSLKR